MDDLSSAHVYLRLKRATPEMKQFRETGKLDHLPIALAECVQLVKANSIEGSKQSKVGVIYTPWENLKKTGDMADGQVSFKDAKKVVAVKGVEKDRDVLNRISKTKKVIDKHDSDLLDERTERDRQVFLRQKELAREEEKRKQQEREAHEKLKYDRDYARIFENGEKTVVKEKSVDQKAAVAFEEDFM